MSCPKHCVSKKRYDDLLVHVKALEEKIAALEGPKPKVQKMEDSDELDSDLFDTDSEGFESADEYISSSARATRSKRGGKKKKAKKSKGKGRSKKGKKTRRRQRG